MFPSSVCCEIKKSKSIFRFGSVVLGGGGFTVYLIVPFFVFNYSIVHLECKMSLAYKCMYMYAKGYVTSFAGPNHI